jgi:predicted amidophosphoribosyltransferase
MIKLLEMSKYIMTSCSVADNLFAWHTLGTNIDKRKKKDTYDQQNLERKEERLNSHGTMTCITSVLLKN